MPTTPVRELKRNLGGRNVGSRFGAGELVPLPFVGAPAPSPCGPDDVLRVLAEDRSDDR